MTPIAVIGLTYREAPTEQRAALLRVARDTSLFERLRASGAVSAVASIATCSRVEWLLSAENPRWAAELACSGLAAAGFAAHRLHVRYSDAALHYLAELTLGLDSVCEGEGAVARQVLAGLRAAHAGEATDRALRLVWKGLEAAVAERRSTLSVSAGRGIQSLVLERLRVQCPAAARVVVWGQGEMGQAVRRALLAGGFEVEALGRRAAADFAQAAQSADALVVTTGADQPYLEVPRSERPRPLIDVGCPRQVASAPGWQLIDLDELLEAQAAGIPEAERAALSALATRTAMAVARSLSEQQTPARLARMSAVRQEFLDDQLPTLTAGLPRARAAAIRKAVYKLIHELTRAARESEKSDA